MDNENWSKLGIKEKIALISACAAFFLGWAMSILGFCVPPVGEVADSILWILGQGLLYAASVFGVTAYFKSESVQLRKDMDKHLESIEKAQIQREKLRQNLEIDEIP